MDVDVLQCPLCRSSDLSRVGSYSSFETHARFIADGGKQVVVGAGRARVCLACGYLMLFVADGDRAKVRAIESESPA